MAMHRLLTIMDIIKIFSLFDLTQVHNGEFIFVISPPSFSIFSFHLENAFYYSRFLLPTLALTYNLCVQ